MNINIPEGEHNIENAMKNLSLILQDSYCLKSKPKLKHDTFSWTEFS